MTDTKSLLATDAAHVWHPFTQMKEHTLAPPHLVVSAQAGDLTLADGRVIFDGVSSWWTSVHGHGHPSIVKAIADQAKTLDHVMFAGFTHEPAVEVARRLVPRLPRGLTRIFFSDDGSTAVEVALKMAFQAQHQKGERGRTRLGALRGAYHGDTLGAVGVGELENFMTALFSPLLLRCERLEVPEDPRREIGREKDDVSQLLATAERSVREYFARHGDALAAFIVEPLIQGAGGMRMWPKELLSVMREECSRHGVYFIFDEVMTGFGRTGTFFASDQVDVTPDILCLSKGLTAGALPLALTCATEELFGCFWGEVSEQKAFLHGHSFTANPIACAAAAANLKLFDEGDVLLRASQLASALRDAWGGVAGSRGVRHARTLGGIAACQLVSPSGDPLPASARSGLEFHRRALERGLLVRPIGDCLYFMPPIATPLDKVGWAVSILAAILNG